ncbi:microsomal triglyceride transfer protein-like isoform X2 [Centruroides vittatus]|uniref:microsomal triglyceride transfer protein-like isoform X2 n=1 Tax=Centruroides vittatus TaxID=120091 RepID=UPI00350F89B6
METYAFVAILFCLAGWLSALPSPARQPYEQDVTYHYQYEFQLNLNDNTNQSTSTGRSVGYKVTANALISNVWQSNENPEELLLKLEINKPKLHVSTIHSMPMKLQSHMSKLDQMSDKPIYIHWISGHIKSVYESVETVSISNLKKGIASLFQIQLKSKNSTELDASGYCIVYYYPQKNHVKKVKKNCRHSTKTKQFRHPNQIQNLALQHDNEIGYELVKNYYVVKTALGNEKVKIYLNVWKNTSVIILSQSKLTLKQETQNNNKVKAFNVDKAIYLLSKAAHTQFIKGTLLTEPDNQICIENCKSLQNVLKEYQHYLIQDNLASLKSTVAFLKVLEQFRTVSTKDITDALKNTKYKQILPQLIDVLAASQIEQSVKIARDTMSYSKEEDLPERFLLSLSTASHPSHNLLNDLLEFSKTKFKNDKLKTSALMALGALTKSFCKMHKNNGDKLVQEIQDFLTKKLQECNDENCALMYLHALKNAALPNTIPILLRYVMRNSKASSVAMMAIKAAAEDHILNDENKLLLKKIYHQLWKYQDSTTRIIAAELLIKGNTGKSDLEELLLSLANQDNPELSTFIHAKLEEIRENNHTLRNLLNEILKNSTINNYYNIAQKGSSAAFKRLIAVGDTANFTFGVNMEMIPGGMLKRSTFDLILSTYEEELKLLSIGLFTNGFGSNSDDNADIPVEDETAGMELNIFGVNLRPFTFFTGRGELMSHVWSGTASEQTPIIQGNYLFMDSSELFGLQNGLLIDINLKGVLSLDLSGSIQISLWNKNAHSVLLVNASVLMIQSVQVDTSYAKSRIDYTMGGESLLDITTNLDFYEKPSKLCIQVQQPHSTFRQNIRKMESVPGSQHLIRTLRKKIFYIPGKSFALHKKNYLACAAMLES